MADSWSPYKLDAAVIEQCADIVVVQRRDIFDPILTKLVAGARRRTELRAIANRIAPDDQVKARKRKIAKTFIKEFRGDPAFQLAFPSAFPYGTTFVFYLWLTQSASTRQRGPKPGRLPHEPFIILLCALVMRAGKLTLDDNGNSGTLVELLKTLQPHLPKKGFALSAHQLRRSLEKARRWARSGKFW